MSEYLKSENVTYSAEPLVERNLELPLPNKKFFIVFQVQVKSILGLFIFSLTQSLQSNGVDFLVVLFSQYLITALASYGILKAF